MGEALQWLSPLKVATTVFLSQLAKEAASDVYKNKAKIPSRACTHVRRETTKSPLLR
jgi:hypothetical protein